MWVCARGRMTGLTASALLIGLLGTAEVQGQWRDTNQVVAPELFGGLDYRMVGPSRGGRVTAVAGHGSHPGVFYMGASGGGVWKTLDYGQNWSPISDGYFATASIGAIRVAPSDPTVVYVGTGSDGIRSNVITGRGMYRSRDSGATWSHIGLPDAGQIGAVEVHPRDPDRVFVAALGNAFARNPDRGVYRSSDGGATWDQVLFTSDSVGAIDIEIHPTNPDIIYAGMWRGERKPWTIISGMESSAQEDGIWRSADGGDTWSYIDLDLNSGLIGKTDFAVSAADPNRVYALVESIEPDEGLYRSDDAGLSWRFVTGQEGLMDRPFYYTNVDADPSDADRVFVSATRFWRSSDGGQSFERANTMHGDNHDLWIDPNDPGLWVQSNDGGASVTRDDGATWSSQSNQPTAELYQVHVDDRYPYWLYAGQQDNTTIMVPSRTPEVSSPSGPEGLWREIGGCETGPAVPKPGNPDIVYSNCKGRFGRYSHQTGQEKQYYVGAANLYGVNPRDLAYRFQRVVPIAVSPHDPNTVYHGSQYVHRTRDEGVTWERISPDLTAFRPERQVISGGPITRDITGEEHYSTLYVIEPSGLERGVIWTGANDGPVHVTRDEGVHWTDVTPPEMPPEGRIQSIEASPHTPGKAYVAGYRYLLGDFRPYIYRTTDYGESWALLTDGTNGIPDDTPTRVVREDPGREGLLYAGTEFGMYVSFDDGAHWQSFQLDLPLTPITDLKVINEDLVVSTMGRSFWILDNLTPLHEISAERVGGDVHLFEPRTAVRVRSGGGFGFGESASGRPDYSGSGVHIDYIVGENGTAPVVIEILDAEGRVLTGFSSEDEGYRFEEGQGMRSPGTRRVGGPQVAVDPGMHRLVWDMRAPSGATRRGPIVPPGEYQVRLSADGTVAMQPLHIVMDPRVEADGVTEADLQEQFAINLRIQSALGTASELVRAVEELETELNLDADGDSGRVSRSLARVVAVREALVTKSGASYQQPMLVAQFEYLYGMTTRADQKPGADAHARLSQLSRELEALQSTFEEVRSAR